MDEKMYFGKTSERVKRAETKLKSVFEELKSILQDCSHETLETRWRSLPLPKDFSYFGLEREHLIKRTLKVPQINKECLNDTSLLLDSTLNSDHDLDSFPLLLHQHYTDRCENLRILESLLIKGWMRRMNKGISDDDDDDDGGGDGDDDNDDALNREESYKTIEDKLKQVREDLIDCHERVIRLTPSRESYLTRDTHNLLTSIEPDDLLNYLMFVVERFKGTKKIQQFLKIIHWLPYSLEFEEMAQETMKNLSRDNDGPSNRNIPTELDFKGNRCVPIKARFEGRRGHGPMNRKELGDRLKMLLDEYGVTRDIDSISFVGEEASLCKEVIQVFNEKFGKQGEIIQPDLDNLQGQVRPESSEQTNAIGREELGQVKFMTNLRNMNKVEPLLDSMNKLFRCADRQKVVRSLKRHITELKKQTTPKSLNLDERSTTSKKSKDKNRSNELEDIFLSIYSNPELTCRSKHDATDTIGYSVINTITVHDKFDPIKLLGLSEDEHNLSDPSIFNGALMSFYLLRHLKVKDIRKQCYDIIQFFNQLQSMLTSESCKECKSSNHYSISRLKDEHENEDIDLSSSAKNRKHGISRMEGLKKLEKEIKSADVMNRNVFDAVGKDFNLMERDLLLVGTHCIKKSLLRESKVNNNNNNNKNNNNNNSDLDEERVPMDISWYGRCKVDRFEVIHDLWSCQRSLLVSLEKLIKFYVDCYRHTCDGNNRRRIRDLLLQLLSMRLPFTYPGTDDDDNDGDYFCENFYLESKCIKLEVNLMEKIKEDVVGHDGSIELNLNNPLSFLHIFHHSFLQNFKKLSKVGGASSSLKYLRSKVMFYTKALDAWNDMELLGSSYSNPVQQDLFNGSIIDSPQILCDLVKGYISSSNNHPGKRSNREKHLNNLTCIANAIDLVTVRHRLIQAAWETEIFTAMYKKLSLALRMEECNLYLRPIGFEYTKLKVKFDQSIGSLFPNYDENYSHILDRFVPNSLLLSIHELDETQMGKFSFLTRENIEQFLKNKSSLENLRLSLTTQTITNRLLTCSFEKVLSIKNYKRLNGRIFASQSEKVKHPTTKAVKSEDNEYKNETKNFELKIPHILKIPSNNNEIKRSEEKDGRMKMENPMENGYLSIQLEKSIIRENMFEHFLKSIKDVTELINKPDDFEKIKRKYILEYCKNLNRNIFIHECCINLINISISISRLLTEFPILRKFFEPISDLLFNLLNSSSLSPSQSNQTKDKKSPTIDNDNNHGDEMMMEQNFLNCHNITTNPWTLLTPVTIHRLVQKLIILSSSLLQLEAPSPAMSSILNSGVKKSNERDMKIAFKSSDLDSRSPFVTSLNSSHVFSMIGDWLLKIQSVNVVICTLCSLATIGGCGERVGGHCTWGSPESIASELFELKNFLRHFQCNDKTTTGNNNVLEFLQLCRDVTLLKLKTLIDIKVGGAIRKKRRRKMAIKDNLEIFYKLKNETLKQLGLSLPSLCDVDQLSFFPPDILSNDIANRNHPWRSILMRTDYIPRLAWPQMINFVHLCFAGFNDSEMKLANAELASLSLALQDVITSTNQNVVQTPPTNNLQPIEQVNAELPYNSIDTSLGEQRVNKISPIEIYSQMKTFLILTNQLKNIKRIWINVRFNRNDVIGCPRTNHVERNAYKRDIIQPILMQASKQTANSPSSSPLIHDDDDDDDNDVMINFCGGHDDDDDDDEKAYNEVKHTMSMTQFMNKQAIGLLEDIELHMMDQSRKIMNKEKTLILGGTYKRMEEDSMDQTHIYNLRQTSSQALKIFMKNIEDDVHRNIKHVADIKRQIINNIQSLLNGNNDTIRTERSDQCVDANTDEGTQSPIPLEGDLIHRGNDGNADDDVSNIVGSDYHHHQQKNSSNTRSLLSSFIDDLLQLNDFMIIRKSTYRDSCSNLTSSLTPDDDCYYRLQNLTVSSCFARIQTLEKDSERLKKKLSRAEETWDVEIATKMADNFADGALEVGALRHRMAELEGEMERRDNEMKERVRRDYDGAFKRVVASLLVSEKNYNQHRLEYCNDVFCKINKSRKEMVEGLARLSLKMSLRMESSNRHHHHHNHHHHHHDSEHQTNPPPPPPNMMERLNEAMEDNMRVESKCNLIRSFNFWRLYCAESRKRREITDLRAIVDKCLMDKTRSTDYHEKEKIIITEELFALKKSYSNLKFEFDDIKRSLDREIKDETSKNHLMEGKIKSAKLVEEAFVNKIKELNEEVEMKEELLTCLTSDLQKTKNLKVMAEDRLKKDVEEANRKLKKERSLKLDAFQEVNKLLGEIQKQSLTSTETTWASKRNPLIRSSSSAKKWPRAIVDQSMRSKSAFVHDREIKEGNRSKTLDEKYLNKKNATQIQVTELIADQIFNDRCSVNHQPSIRANPVLQIVNNNNNNKLSMKSLRPVSQYYKSAYL